MSIEQRRHIRFSLDIPALRFTKFGERVETVLKQISIGGCLMKWDAEVFVGEEFRLLAQLPNKNFLPLQCKVLYRAEDLGIGAKFLDITQFEQELLTKIITRELEKSGLPMQVNPFAQANKPARSVEPKITNERARKEEILEDILSGGD